MPALKKRLEKAISLGNLPTLQGMLHDLEVFTNTEKVPLSQISEHLSSDPSLSVRLLRMANSAYYARSEPVVSIEEAILFLGIAQIRTMAMTTRCVEAMCPEDRDDFHWVDFWRHCIATAHLTRLIGKSFDYPDYNPELAYMVGLLHDVGKLVIAMLSPDPFRFVVAKAIEGRLSFEAAEKKYSDTDHGALGGWYLERQNLPALVYEGVRCHHKWDLAVKCPELPAMVNVADFVSREHHLGCSGNMECTAGAFTETAAWSFLTHSLPVREDVREIQEKLNAESVRLEDLVDSLLPRDKQPSLASSDTEPAVIPSGDGRSSHEAAVSFPEISSHNSNLSVD